MRQYLGRMNVMMVLAIMLSLVTVPVSAYEPSEAGQTAVERQKEDSERLKQKAAEARQKVSEIRAQSKQRLDDAKRKICAGHQAAINRSMGRVIEQRQKQIDHITEISTRVQDFYTKRGHALANYDALVNDVNTEKAAAQAALDAIKSGATFSCDSDGPKAELRVFREKRNVVLTAIKAYRQSVKTLIVDVKSVQPDKETQS